MESQDQLLLLVGEIHGTVKEINNKVGGLDRRVKSLEQSRTKYTAIFGVVGAGIGSLVTWIKGN